ncbi:hypothetical protein F5879DRAFT_812840 [Lentinula edodes]|nr:hypothetical protein F5879DRAFT_812840 [Lentinula edodes]
MKVVEESVSNTWIQKLKKYRDLIKSVCGSGLDPKRTQAFNFTTVHEYFEELNKVLKKGEVPWELVNIWEEVRRIHSNDTSFHAKIRKCTMCTATSSNLSSPCLGAPFRRSVL